MSQTVAQSAADAAHFLATNQHLLTIAAETLSAAPHLTAAGKQARGQTVIAGIMAFLPTEPVQTILASQAVGTHLSAMEGFRELAVSAMTPALSAKARMVGVVQAKLILETVRELRIVRKAALEIHAAEQAARHGAVTEAQGDATAQVAAGAEAPQSSAAPTQAPSAGGETPLVPGVTGPSRQGPESTPANVPPPATASSTGPQGKPAGSRAFRRALMKQRGEFRKVS